MGAHRHAFRFKVTTNEGQEQVLKAWAKVRKARTQVNLTLIAADVRRSMQLGGVGNTQTCSMAVCAKRHKFPHPVEGYIDWQYSMAYVVSKVSKATGMPVECYAYRHEDSIAKLNDTKGGQQKLLKELETKGDRIIRLYPPQKKRNRPGRPAGQRDGSRSSRPAGAGAKLRFAMANLGGVG